MEIKDLLERRGFQNIRGNRCDCLYCEGASRGTVSIGSDTWHCFRCDRSGGTNSLLRELGLPVTPESLEEKQKRDERERFERWRDACEWAIIDWLRKRARLIPLVNCALAHFPDLDEAWSALREYYDAMAALEMLSCEKNPEWIETPMDKEKLLAIYRTAVNVSAGVAA